MGNSVHKKMSATQVEEGHIETLAPVDVFTGLDVATLLGTINPDFASTYGPMFVEHGFEARHSLQYITYDDMLHMGVKRGHARVIEAELRLPAPVEHQPVVVDSTQTPRRAAYTVGGVRALGGAIGFVKSGSKASLAAGLSTALVLGYAGHRMKENPVQVRLQLAPALLQTPLHSSYLMM